MKTKIIMSKLTKTKTLIIFVYVTSMSLACRVVEDTYVDRH